MSATVERIAVFLLAQNRLPSSSRILSKKSDIDISVVGGCEFTSLSRAGTDHRQLWDQRETERRRTADKEAREALNRSRKGR